MSEHTKEPWELIGYSIHNADKYISYLEDIDDDDARRIADEPKEREAEENNCPMIEAWVWPSGEWKIQAASAQQWKEHGIFQIVPIFSRSEVERKLKEAEQ